MTKTHHNKTHPDFEDTKYQIYKKLIKDGFSVWTECIFNDGGRADIFAVRGKEAYVVEVETSKSEKEMQKKIEQKEKYPDEGPARGRPYDGIENLRPETKAAVEAFLTKQKSPTM